MAFTENKEFNSLTPEDIYTVSKGVKNILIKLRIDKNIINKKL